MSVCHFRRCWYFPRKQFIRMWPHAEYVDSGGTPTSPSTTDGGPPWGAFRCICKAPVSTIIQDVSHRPGTWSRRWWNVSDGTSSAVKAVLSYFIAFIPVPWCIRLYAIGTNLHIMSMLIICRTFILQAKHTADHIGKFYVVPQRVQSGLFNVYQLTKKARQLHKLAGEFSIMVRAPFLEVRDYIQNYDYSQPAFRVMLYGRLGTGKSHTMAHIMHYAYTNDYLLVAKSWCE